MNSRGEDAEIKSFLSVLLLAECLQRGQRNLGDILDFVFSVDLTQILISLLSEFKIHFWHFAV